MMSWSYQIRNAEGLHARPIARIVMGLLRFSCQVTVVGTWGQADGRDLMKLMSLNSKQGDILEFSFEGKDEKEASEAMQKLLGEIDL